MSDDKKKGWVPKSKFKPGGSKGKLHRALGIPEGEKIPATRLESAKRSPNPDVRQMAIRAEAMKHWDHSGKSRADHRYRRRA